MIYCLRCCACMLVLMTVADSTLAGSPTLACNRNDAPLERTTPDVLFDEVQFVDGGKTFPLHVFSLAGPTPWRVNTICFGMSY